MRRQSIRAINLRISSELKDRLETAAQEHRVSINQRMRQLLEDGLKAKQSLADFLADLEREVRDAVERKARNSKDVETPFRCLADLRAHLAGFQTGIEKILLPYMQDPELRERIRGAQQKQKEGGKS